MDGCTTFLFEILVKSIFNGYLHLMQQIIPKKVLTEKTCKTLIFFINVTSVLLLISILIGIISNLYDNRELGKKLILIPVGIIVAQMGLGVIVHSVTNKK